MGMQMNTKTIQRPAPNLDGPENVRITITHLPVVVAVYNLKSDDDKPTRINYLDFSNPFHRAWLGRMTAYACHNGLSVETMSVEEWEKLN